MSLKGVTKSVVDRSLKVARTPVDLTMKAAGASRSPAKLAVDRAEAGIRGAAGTILRNPGLKQDAKRRELAAEERERALTLEREAEAREQEARERAEADRKRAAEKRARAARDAQKRKDEAAKQRKAEEAKAKRAAEARKKTAAKAAEKTAKENAKRQKAAELESLRVKEETLDAKEKAVRTERESKALADAAAAAKAERKGK
jgi:hypothetical protein